MKEESLFLILKKSFFLLKKEPKLFIPKIIIAILYGLAIIFEGQILLKLIELYPISVSTINIAKLSETFTLALILFIFSIFIYLIDTITTAIYPSLVSQFPSKISFKKAYFDSKKRFKPAVISSIIVLLITIILISIITIPIILLSYESIVLQMTISLTIGFVIVFLFYLLFPTIMLENKGIIKSIKSSIQSSFDNKKNIFSLSLIPLIISILKLWLAINFDNLFAIVLFILLVFLTGILHTYSTIATQTTYFSIKNKKIFKKL